MPRMTFEGREELKEDEGYRARSYKCTAGFWTIGWGHNLDANWLEKEYLMRILNGEDRSAVFSDVLIDDVSKVEAGIGVHKDLSFLLELGDEVRTDAFINLVFNLGETGLAKFKRTLGYARECTWGKCADELIDSNWYRQVGRRGPRIVNQVRTGERA